jgi:aspartyl-tRNA(Asn)/glutamyl-tRNA(Gln) amidotransferase subunit A
VGLRPTFGRVSRYGGVMYGWTADTIGPLTRTVEDNAMFLQAIAGHDERDPLTSTRALPDYREHLGTDLKGLRLGVVREMTWPDGINAEVRAALASAIEVLKALGAQVEDVSLKLARFAVPLQMLTSDSDIASMMLTKYLRRRYADLDVGTRTRLAAGALVPSAVYHRAMRARVLVRREVLELMRDYDALISPTNLNPPGRIEATVEKVESAEDMVRKILLRRISTYPFSMANTPALSVPCGYTKNALPMAMQIAAKPFDESMVYRVGHAYERATEWHRRHPDLDTTLARAD